MRFSTSSAAALVATIPFATAQTFTDCDPTKKTCDNNIGLPEDAFSSDFTSVGGNRSWTAAAYSTITYSSNGAEFGISGTKQAPTMESDFYIFFGRVDVKMRAAKGTGIVSSIVFESDDLDEIDWEFLGGDTDSVQTNFFGKGNTTSYDRMVEYPVSSPQDELHTYSVDWNSDRIEWIIDGTTVRTLTYDDALCVGGKNFPQTPMRVKLGNWCGGCDGQPKGTIEWAGGKTTFDDAPYVMYVEQVSIQNYNPADAYEWSDMSGSWESIKLIKDGSASQPSGKHGSSESSVASTATSEPTKSHGVDSVKSTGHMVSKTVPGKSYNTSAPYQTTGIKTSIVQATTRVPGAQPTGGNGIEGASPSESAAADASGVTPSTGGAAAKTVMASTALFGLLFSLLL
ncbi:hypothetical protein LTR37_019662 [Vermiconidia calcicola]|uniref:Uncharacterized protein n=1 Tax=Vermiconidia calcicola TaxID=1690605 RepID=A0ACC3MEN9_9PEZI|nr:hypothetical protein LTR37_019662 [Vermiconidia calcicola]